MILRILTILFFMVQMVMAQLDPISVADLTLKVGGLGNEELYYGFAEGDQIIFSFEEKNGKGLKEIEIIELPSNSKFMDFKSSRIENKTFHVHKKGVYLFKLTNGALGGRICKIHIQRIPKSEDLITFNTNWRWETFYDTTYVPYTEDSLVGYNNVTVKKNRKELVSVDTLAMELFSKTERVHSETALGKSQYSTLNVQLPQNSYSPAKFNPYQSTEVVAWSYWIGVGQKANEEYEKANKNLTTGIKVIGSLTGYGALASLAVTGISMFEVPSVGDNVRYQFISTQYGAQRVFDSGNGIAASARHSDILQGGFTIQLYNDNVMEGIDVTVKVAVVSIRKTWCDKEYIEQRSEPKYVTLNKQRMVVNSRKVRVNTD